MYVNAPEDADDDADDDDGEEEGDDGAAADGGAVPDGVIALSDSAAQCLPGIDAGDTLTLTGPVELEGTLG